MPDLIEQLKSNPPPIGPHGYNEAVYEAACVEGGLGIDKVLTHPCPGCGIDSRQIYYFETSRIGEADEISARALLIAGWDGKTGCVAQSSTMLAALERLASYGLDQPLNSSP